jgi:hypothetical protein
MDQEKRRHRQLKRDVKKAGNRKRRQALKRDLERNPADAAHTQFDFGRDSSAGLNGIDRDATRRRGAEDSPPRHQGHQEEDGGTEA